MGNVKFDYNNKIWYNIGKKRRNNMIVIPKVEDQMIAKCPYCKTYFIYGPSRQKNIVDSLIKREEKNYDSYCRTR